MARLRKKTRYFYDFEFLDDGKTIDPISVGICCADGREYYAVFRGADWSRILQHGWLVRNVVPYLPMLSEDHWTRSIVTDSPLDVTDAAVKWKSVIRAEVYAFFLADGGGDDRDTRELWAWYSSFDHVLLTQLFGRMVPDLPRGVPMHTNDIKSVSERLGNPPRPKQRLCEHHSLHDARYDEELLKHFERVEAQRMVEASQQVACCPMDLDTAQEMLDVMRGWSDLP